MFRLLLLLALAGSLRAQNIAPPTVNDERLEATLFAAEPMIVHPTGTAVDARDRLFVVETHTHFRTPEWKGPEHDQIVILEDTDGDGRADQRTVFFDQTDATMDIAIFDDGWVYLATRDEILRLKDTTGDGRADQVERRLVWLETDCDYPHNGFSGLAADGRGGLYFGMGENLGAPYRIEGSDGTAFEGGGEGGFVWHCKLDGGWLKQIATGFWNPYGVCVDPWGNVFATDNDPSSRPPCRLHHVVPGGDYGFQFRYGRSGLHPFTSWNGERPGTLPMMAATGEAPCDVFFHQGRSHPAWRGLTSRWNGSLLVASWVDHRIEAYRPIPQGGSFRAERKHLCEGGADFRPVAMAESSNGTLFVTDWVKRDYKSHGFGRVWKIASKEPQAIKVADPVPPKKNADERMIDEILTGPAPSHKDALAWLSREDPHLFHAAVQRLSREPPLVKALAREWMPEMRQRVGLLLATRRGMHREGVPSKEMPIEFTLLVERCLTDVDPWVVLEALRWIADDRIQRFKSRVEDLTRDPEASPDILVAAITTMARLANDGEIVEKDIVAQTMALLENPDLATSQRRALLTQLPEWGGQVTSKQVLTMLDESKDDDRLWLTHYLGLLPDDDDEKETALREIAYRSTEQPDIRIAALIHLPATPEDASLFQTALDAENDLWISAALTSFLGIPLPLKAQELIGALPITWADEVSRVQGKSFIQPTRPRPNELSLWPSFVRQIEGEPDYEHGKQVFLSPKAGGCAACHRIDGLGRSVGPDLSRIHEQADPNAILQSILQPSAAVAPQYECFSITTTDGRSLTLFRIGENGGVGTYIDLAGKTVSLKIEEIARRDSLPMSIMPEGLTNRLTDREVRDLLFFLTHPAPTRASE